MLEVVNKTKTDNLKMLRGQGRLKIMDYDLVSNTLEFEIPDALRWMYLGSHRLYFELYDVQGNQRVYIMDV